MLHMEYGKLELRGSPYPQRPESHSPSCGWKFEVYLSGQHEHAGLHWAWAKGMFGDRFTLPFAFRLLVLRWPVAWSEGRFMRACL
jgi:hypothetical protein